VKGTYRVRIPDGGLQKTLAVGSTPWTDDLQSGNGSVPSGVILRVLSTDTGSGTVRTSEDDGTWDISTRHVVCLSSRVDNLINGLHGEIPGHFSSALVLRMSEGNVLNSQTGRRPARAAPTAIPPKPDSVMGV
jgi:hypothetical protein